MGSSMAGPQSAFAVSAGSPAVGAPSWTGAKTDTADAQLQDAAWASKHAGDAPSKAASEADSPAARTPSPLDG
eukprot:scaffold168198_cov31-Tisochrysis_lutea.AAC.3